MKQRDIQVRAILRDPPDLDLLAKALIQLAIEEQQKKLAQETKARRPSK